MDTLASSSSSAATSPTSGRTVPIWYEQYSPPSYPPLSADATADVCVVGAGIAGITTAYLLAKAGRSVIVLEGKAIAGGESGRTSAHLASAIDDRFFEIERVHGQEGARIQYQSHAAAIDLIEKIVAEENINCDFKRIDGYLFAGTGDTQEVMERELEAARRAGVADVEPLDACPAGGVRAGACLRFGRQARFQPLVFVGELARRLAAMGVRLYSQTHVNNVESKEGVVQTTTQRGPVVRSQHAVLATNVPSPVNNWAGIYTKFAPYRTYMVGLEVTGTAIGDALYWDNEDPYHYVRLHHQDGRVVLLVGGEDHKTGQHADDHDLEARFERLAEWARRNFDGVGAVVSRWSGQVNEPDDGVAFIGAVPTSGHDNCYLVTGDSGMGLTHGVLGARLIADLIEGRPSPWEELYRPSRKPPLKAASTFISENANAAAQYADYLTPGEVKSTDEIAPDTGAILRRGLKKVAVYKDKDGTLHECSAACTHLKGVVCWNDTEKSWDCPLHGSRFGPKGEVLHGPAVDGLPPA